MLRNNKMHWVAEPQLLFSIFLLPLSLCCTLSLLDLFTQQSVWLRWIKLCTNYLIYILCLITTKDSPHSCKCFCIHVWVCQIQRDEFRQSRTFPSVKALKTDFMSLTIARSIWLLPHNDMTLFWSFSSSCWLEKGMLPPSIENFQNHD